MKVIQAAAQTTRIPPSYNSPQRHPVSYPFHSDPNGLQASDGAVVGFAAALTLMRDEISYWRSPANQGRELFNSAYSPAVFSGCGLKAMARPLPKLERTTAGVFGMTPAGAPFWVSSPRKKIRVSKSSSPFCPAGSKMGPFA